MKCIICGKEVEKSMYSNACLCSSDCFSVNFWNECLDDSAIIINGECYHDGGTKPSDFKGFLGHAGHVFTIRMKDGRVFSTNNLWYNGEVPEERQISDNAEFITQSKDTSLPDLDSSIFEESDDLF